MPNPQIKVHPGLNPQACFELVLQESEESTASLGYHPVENWLSLLAQMIKSSTLVAEELGEKTQKQIEALLEVKINRNPRCLSALKKLYGLMTGGFQDKRICANREILLLAIAEGLSACPEGFSDRILATWHSLNSGNLTLPQRLQTIREQIVHTTARQISDGVHDQNTVTRIAREMGLGTRITNVEDRYHGNVSPKAVRSRLETNFNAQFTPHLIVAALEEQLLEELRKLGYRGYQDPLGSQKGGYTDVQWRSFFTHLQPLLPNITFENLSLFLPNDEELSDPKLNWPQIRRLLIEQLKEKGYFKKDTDLTIMPSPAEPEALLYWAKLVRQHPGTGMDPAGVCAVILSVKREPDDSDDPHLLSTLLRNKTRDQLEQVMLHAMNVFPKDASSIWDEVKKYMDTKEWGPSLKLLLKDKSPRLSFLLPDIQAYLGATEQKTPEIKPILGAFSLVNLSVDQMNILFRLRNKSGLSYPYSVEEQEYLEKLILSREGLQLLPELPKGLKKIVATKENVLTSMLRETDREERDKLLRRALSPKDPLFTFFAERRGVLPTNPYVGTFAKIRSILDKPETAAKHLSLLTNFKEEQAAKELWLMCIGFSLATFVVSLSTLLAGFFILSIAVGMLGVMLLGVVLLVNLIEKIYDGIISLINRCKRLPDDYNPVDSRPNGEADERRPPLLAAVRSQATPDTLDSRRPKSDGADKIDHEGPGVASTGV